MALKVSVGGIDRTSILESETLEITQEAGVLTTTCSFSLIDATASIAIAAKSALLVEDDATGMKYFRGTVAGIDYEVFGDVSRYIHIDGQDFNILPDEYIITGLEEFGAANDNAIIDSLFDAYLPAVDSVTYVTNLFLFAEISFENITLASALNEICKQSGGQWYIDEAKALHYFSSEATAAPWGLSDTPNESTTFGYLDKPEKEVDATQVVTRVLVVGADVAILTIDAAAEAALGTQFGAVVRDNTLEGVDAVTDRGEAIVEKYSMPLSTYRVRIDKAGLSAGEDIGFKCGLYDIDATFTIRRITITWPTNVAEYELELGDVRISAATSAQTRGASIADVQRPISPFRLPVSSKGWVHGLAFSATDHNTVAWAAGIITSADGTEYNIVAGNTGNIAATTYIYLDLDTSETVLQTTTSQATAAGVDKLLVAWATPVGAGLEAIFLAFNGAGMGVLVDTDNIADGAVDTLQIAALAVETAKIALLAIDTAQIAAGAVEAAKIGALAVTTGKIAALAVDSTKLAALAVTTAKIANNAVDTLQIANLAVEAAQIGAQAVTTGKIAALAVDDTKIAALAVTTAKIALLAVTAGQIGAQAVETAKIKLLAVEAAQIGNNVITANQILANTITATEIAALTITAAEIVAGTITGAKVAANTIESGNIKALTIVAGDIAASTITGAKIAANTVEAANIKALTITAAEVAAGTITGAKIAADTIESGNIKALTIEAGDIKGNTITAAQIAALTITAAEIVALTITGAKIAANTIEAGNIAALTITAAEIEGGTITGAKVAADTIESGNIKALTIEASDIKAHTITGGKLVALTIQASEIAAATITGAKIAAATIEGTNIKAGTIEAGNIKANTITATEIAANTITFGEIAGNTITAGNIASGAIGTDELAAISVTAPKIAAGTITADKLHIGVGAQYFTRAGGLLLLGPGCPLVPGSWQSLRGQTATLTGAFHTVNGRWPGTRALMVEVNKTNSIKNPSFGRSTLTSWTALAPATLSAETTNPHSVDACMKIVAPSDYDGATTAVTLLASNPYYLSLYVRSDSALSIALQILDVVAGTDVNRVSKTLTAGQGWTLYEYEFTTHAVNTAYELRIWAAVGHSGTWYVDDVQIETGTYRTSTMSGDFSWCSWTGAAHASTSTRAATGATIPLNKGALGIASGSISLWTQIYNEPDVYRVFFCHNDASSYNRLMFYYDQIVHRYYFRTINNAGGNTQIGATAALGEGLHHIVCTWDTGTTTTRLYINGVLDAESTAAYIPSVLQSSMQLGRFSAAASQYANAAFSEFATFNSVLTAAEVAAIYQSGAPLIDQGATDTPGIYILDGKFQLASSTGTTRIDITAEEIAGYSAGVKQFYLSAIDGKAYAGAGAVVLSSTGINIYGTANALTTRATVAGTIQCSVNAAGAITAGAGAVVLDADGLSIAADDGTINRIKWIESTVVIASMYAFQLAGSSFLSISAANPDTEANGSRADFRALPNGAYESGTVEVYSGSSGGGASVKIRADTASNVYIGKFYTDHFELGGYISHSLAVACMVYNNATQSSAQYAWEIINFNAEIIDDYAMHSTASNTERIVCTIAGSYAGTLSVAQETAPKSWSYEVYWNDNGTVRTIATQGGYSSMTAGIGAVLSFYIPEMAVNDYVYAMVKASGDPGNIAAATAEDPANCCMSVWRVT